MNADAFRHFYAYHFAENCTIWDTHIMPLSQEQFTQPIAYSHGSVRNQVVHMVSVDDTWFSALRGLEIPDPLNPSDFEERHVIRLYWDQVEQNMQAYLANLHDGMLFEKPFPEGEDQDLILWQVLLHVGTHGTDHRAQLLRLLHDLGAQTRSQDYVFFAYDEPVS
ncbi:MAG: DinB family protein [Anaerolineae bacterium]